MSIVQSYKDLIAWQKAFQLGLEIYELTRCIPEHERFGLVSQLRRGAVAVSSNIAEGYGRQSTQDYIRFLRVARGCLYEIETQFLFCIELGYLTTEQSDRISARSAECGRILAGLIRSLECPDQAP